MCQFTGTPMTRFKVSLIMLQRIFLSVRIVHTEKSFRNLVKSNRNQIVFTIFWLIWIHADVHLDPNQSKNVKYNLISDTKYFSVFRTSRATYVEYSSRGMIAFIFDQRKIVFFFWGFCNGNMYGNNSFHFYYAQDGSLFGS